MGRGGGDAESSGCAQPDTRCHLQLAQERWLMARVRCQGTQARGEYSVTSTRPGRFAGVAAPEHSSAVTNCSTCCDAPPWLLMPLLGSWCPSLALLHPQWCQQHYAGPQELQFYRRPVMPWQYKVSPWADLTPHPAGWLSSPAHGWLFCKKASDFWPIQNMRRTTREEQILPWPTLLGWNSRRWGGSVYPSASTPCHTLFTVDSPIFCHALCLLSETRWKIFNSDGIQL